MHCPNCEAFIESGKVCGNCGVWPRIFAGAVRLSERLYDRGLERLRASDFYHGIDFLTKSIAVNKSNVPARNLLGLALFEVGRVGDALKHWVVSHNLEKEGNPAGRYISQVHDGRRALEQLSDAVLMYNKGLAHLRLGKDDLAMIQLKKAIGINPRFVDALNLLSLCYLIQNNLGMALGMAQRVLEIDSQNCIALNYVMLIKPEISEGGILLPPPAAELIAQRTGKLAPAKSPGGPPGAPKKPPPPPPAPGRAARRLRFPIAAVFAFLLGAAGFALVTYFALMPMLEAEHGEEMMQARSEAAQAAAEHGAQLGARRAEIAGLEAEVAELGENVAGLERDNDFMLRQLAAHDAYWLAREGRHREAVELLDNIATNDLPEAVRTLVGEAVEAAYPVLGAEYYEMGLAAFNEADEAGFFAALEYLALAERFWTPRPGEGEEPAYPAQWNEMLLMIGTAHYETNGFLEAYEVLEALAERAPNFRAAAVRAIMESIEGLGILPGDDEGGDEGDE